MTFIRYQELTLLCSLLRDVSQGSLASVQKDYEAKAVIVPEIEIVAAAWGHFHILEWLNEQNYPFSEMAYAVAIDENQRAVAEWLLEKGVKLTEKTALHICDYSFNILHVWCDGNGVYEDVHDFFPPLEKSRTPDLNLRYMMEKGIPVNIEKCLNVSENEHLQDYLINLGKILETWKEWELIGFLMEVSYDSYLQFPPEEVMKDILDLVLI